jgi:hypothetical protein
MYIFKPKGRARIRLGGGNLYVRHLKIPEVANEEAIRRRGAKAAGIGIAVFVFRNLQDMPIGEGLCYACAES